MDNGGVKNTIMKLKSKELIKAYCIGSQIRCRSNKQAKGMTFTNERRARRTGNSFLYAAMKSGTYQITSDCSRLSVYGTLDTLGGYLGNKMKKEKLRRWSNKNKK